AAQLAGARLRASQHDLAITCFYARSYAVSVLVIRVEGSLQTVVKMFTDVLRTSACCVSCWRGDQQSGQYHAKHKWRLALRYRHFSLPQSSSSSRYRGRRIRCRRAPEIEAPQDVIFMPSQVQIIV